MDGGAIFGGIIGLAILVGVFWLCREIFCWYWKISEINLNLAALLEEQKKTNQILVARSQTLGN